MASLTFGGSVFRNPLCDFRIGQCRLPACCADAAASPLLRAAFFSLSVAVTAAVTAAAVAVCFVCARGVRPARSEADLFGDGRTTTCSQLAHGHLKFSGERGPLNQKKHPNAATPELWPWATNSPNTPLVASLILALRTALSLGRN